MYSWGGEERALIAYGESMHAEPEIEAGGARKEYAEKRRCRYTGKKDEIQGQGGGRAV